MWPLCSFCVLRPEPLQRARLPHSSALLRLPHGLAPCWFVSLTVACKFARFAVGLPRPSGRGARARATLLSSGSLWLLRASCLAGHSPPFLYWHAPFPARCPARYPSPSSPRVLAAFSVGVSGRSAPFLVESARVAGVGPWGRFCTGRVLGSRPPTGRETREARARPVPVAPRRF